jgi:starch phosphorylase
MEACGTSGMKACLNCIPHLSILDGWWVEGHNGRNGWAFGYDGGDDEKDAGALYDLLENGVAPLFYGVADDGIPHEWVKVMKEAMISTAPLFSARRMTKEYILRFYRNALTAAG